MRAAPYVLIFVLCCVILPGCSLFRGKTGEDGKGWWLGSNQGQQKKPSSSNNILPDDPLLKSAGGNGDITTLAGRVIDPIKQPLPNAYVRLSVIGDEEPKEAPIDLAVDSQGYFTITNVKKGKRYKLEARAKQGNKTLAKVVETTAPNIRLVMQLREDLVTPGTPPLPPPPGLPKKPVEEPAEKETEKEKTPASKETTGWDPKAVLPPTPPNLPKGGLFIGTPPAVADKSGSPTPVPSWNAAPQPNHPPKFPQGIVGNDPGQKKDPLLWIKPEGSNVPPPPPEAGNAQGGKERPLAVAPAIPVKPQSTAHVPSCVLVGKKLINFALPDFYGNPWEWKTHRQGKLVLLDFWATNCPPCLEAIHHLRSIRNKYGPAGLEILGIAAESKGTLEEQRYRVATVCQLKQTNYRILLGTGPADPVLNQFAVQRLPTLVLIDEDGQILWRHEGALTSGGWDALERYIQMRLGL